MSMDEKRLIRKASHHIYQYPQDGDIMMDMPKACRSWNELHQMAANRDGRRRLVFKIREESKSSTWKNTRTHARKKRALIRLGKSTVFTTSLFSYDQDGKGNKPTVMKDRPPHR